MDCSFCDAIAFDDSSDLQKAREKLGIQTVYSVKYVREFMKNGHEQGYLTSGRYPLNFCPVCGKKFQFDQG